MSGSGKTLCLIEKALELIPQLKNNELILIITFNITLGNNITTRLKSLARKRNISLYRDIYSNIKRPLFKISHFHLLMKILNEKELQNYKYILIDEYQDFNKTMISLFEKKFPKNKHIVYYFADEKQNIYGNDMDETDNKPKSRIKGRWRELRQSHRLNKSNFNLAVDYVQHFLKVNIEAEKNNENSSPGSSNIIMLFDNNIDYIIKNIYNIIKKIVSKENYNNNDVAIITNNHKILRYIIYEHIKVKLKHVENKKIVLNSIKNSTISETLHEYYNLIHSYYSDEIVKYYINYLYYKNKKLTSNTDEIDEIDVYKDEDYDINADYDQLNDNDKNLVDELTEYLNTNRVGDKIDEDNILSDEEIKFIYNIDKFNLDHVGDIKNRLVRYRKSKKFHFHLFSGEYKFSTIQSFKGWEINNLFLIIDFKSLSNIDLQNTEAKNEHLKNFHHLMYTGITRSKQNLYILFINEKYDKYGIINWFLKQPDINIIKSEDII